MKIAIVDSRIPRDAECALSRYADKIVKLPPCSRLQTPVYAHPDMLIFITDTQIITEKQYFEENRAIFEELSLLCGREIVLAGTVLSPNYPNDVKFNSFTAGGRLFGLESALSETVLAWAKKALIPVVNIRQGYAKCSTCVVTENAVITENASIEKAMLENGIDVLTVAPGHVVLDGYDFGFIGGASGADGENVYFCGNVSQHPDFDEIENFCRCHGKNCVSLGAGRLYDIGTIYFLE